MTEREWLSSIVKKETEDYTVQVYPRGKPMKWCIHINTKKLPLNMTFAHFWDVRIPRYFDSPQQALAFFETFKHEDYIGSPQLSSRLYPKPNTLLI